MPAEIAFLQEMMCAPHDPAVRQVYADWLEERGDPRAEYLRLEARIEELERREESSVSLNARFNEIRTTIQPAWIAFMNSLCRPFHPAIPEIFPTEPERMPFLDRIGRRGWVMTFESQFRRHDDTNTSLGRDLHLLSRLDLDQHPAGVTLPIHPFMAHTEGITAAPTATEVLKALHVKHFRPSLLVDLTGTNVLRREFDDDADCDEIHGEFKEYRKDWRYGRRYERGPDQLLHEFIEWSWDEDCGDHGLLKASVVEGRLWYVALHTTPRNTRPPSAVGDFVFLFVVGKSVLGDRLIGTITGQALSQNSDTLSEST